MIDPNTYLTCYQAKGGTLDPKPKVQVSTQFQVTSFALKKPKMLCAPSTKSDLP